MPIDRGLAVSMSQQGVERVMRRWGNHIPLHLRTVKASDIFLFYSDETFLRDAFAPTWDGLFKRVSGSSATSEDVVLPAGFVTPERDPLHRKVHINLNAEEFDWLGLMTHEFIHWLSHEEFFPVYFQSSPGSFDRFEGITDYLMLKCMSGYADGLIPASLQKYHNVCAERGIDKLSKDERACYNWSGQYDRAKRWIKADPDREETLLKYVFQGAVIPLDF